MIEKGADVMQKLEDELKAKNKELRALREENKMLTTLLDDLMVKRRDLNVMNENLIVRFLEQEATLEAARKYIRGVLTAAEI